MTQVIPRISAMFGRRFADLLSVLRTSTELVILFLLTPTFTIADWIYVLQHFIVLGIALTRLSHCAEICAELRHHSLGRMIVKSDGARDKF